MDRNRDPKTTVRKGPLTISRVFSAPRDVVFKAWSSADHIKRWFSPEDYSAPHAEVDFRPGGIFIVCMRSPEGQDFWSRGSFIEISPPERLCFTSGVSIGGETKFTVHTTVTFENEGGGTRMSVRQCYDIHDENFLSAVDGASEGWRTTLDKLEKALTQMQGDHPRSAVHATFSLERVFKASPTELFRAFSDKAAKARWFEGGPGFKALERKMDVRPGGRERLKGQWESGVTTTFDAVYFDVVPNERLIYAYEMTYNERKISVSLATVQIKRADEGARLVISEQGVFLDGYDDAGSRERGTAMLLGRLTASLEMLAQ